MNCVDKQYIELVNDVLNNGHLHPTRAKINGNNVSAYTVFGRQARFKLDNGFPILTTKKVSFNNIAHEFAWMIRGDTNTKYLEDNKVSIWREWASDDGELGPVYGKQFRRIEYNEWVKPLKLKNNYDNTIIEKRSVYGVGYYGDDDKKDINRFWLIDLWRQMIRRCYDKTCKAYKSYGGVGVFVDKDWHCFANFQKDVQSLPNWYLKLEYKDSYSLDKDILYASNCYSKKTCMWASSEEQQLNGSTHRCLNGKLKTHHNWSNFKYVNKNGYILRTRIIDQLKGVIANIKHNPNDRRMVITLWSPGDLPKMALPPCHGIVIQFYVNNGKLSLSTYQRSVDTFLGYPYNISWYSLLLCVIAHLTNLIPYEIIYSLGNLHIYSNHVEQMREQLDRESLDLPILWINPELNSIDDFVRSDVKLIGYQHRGVLRGEVAV